MTFMKYKVRYEEVHVFEEFVEAESEEQAISQVIDNRVMLLTFDSSFDPMLTPEYPDPVEIKEIPGSYRAICAVVE